MAQPVEMSHKRSGPVAPGRRMARGSMRHQTIRAMMGTAAVARWLGVTGRRVNQANVAAAARTMSGRMGQGILLSNRAMMAMGKTMNRGQSEAPGGGKVGKLPVIGL